MWDLNKSGTTKYGEILHCQQTGILTLTLTLVQSDERKITCDQYIKYLCHTSFTITVSPVQQTAFVYG
jgi:hypothetical protein